MATGVDDQNSPTPQDSPEASITWQDYMLAVSLYSQLATPDFLYPGHLYRKFVQAGVKRSYSSYLPGGKDHVPAMALITFDETSTLTRHFYRDVGECIEAIKGSSAGTRRSKVLFLNGYFEPSTVAQLGALCQTDPAYFQSHLRFLCGDDFYSTPSLPSSSENIIRLRFVTIGSRDSKAGISNQTRVDKMRQQGREQMEAYTHGLKLREIEQGQSVVRGYEVIDEKHFLIEQELSICLNYLDGQWLIFVWSDVGNDLSVSPPGPWLPNHGSEKPLITFKPTIQHTSRVALRIHHLQSSPQAQSQLANPQTAHRLPQDCGKLLDAQTMATDPFYALTDIFRFFCYSESAFLNLLESLISSDTDLNSLNKHNPTLSNLLCCQELARKHLLLLQCNLQTFNRRGGRRWQQPTCSGGGGADERAEMAALRLVDDMEHLIKRTEELLQRCSRGMNVIMSNVMLGESRRATSQAQGVAKLTVVAFFFIPLSFSTSFFSMDLKELKSANLSIWVWFVVSVPLLIASIAVLFINFQDVPFLRSLK